MNVPNDAGAARIGQAISRLMRRSSRDLLALAFLLFVTLAFFWPVWFGAWLPQGGGDLVSFLWPQYSFAAQSIRSGSIPLWNPQLYSGAPFLADNQAGALYPINLLAFLIFPTITYQVMEGLVIFHIWLAGACMYAALRMWPPLFPPRVTGGMKGGGALTPGPCEAPRLRGSPIGRGAALLGAIAFMFNDVFVTHIGNLNLIAAAAWLPLIFALFARGLAHREVRSTLAAGGVFAMALLAGHAQMTAITLIGLAVIGVWQIAGASSWRDRGRVTGLAVVATIAAAGLSALQLLPSLEMTRYSLRAGLSYNEATAYSLPPTALASTFSPLLFGRGAIDFWGPWPRVETIYIGVIPLLLAGLAWSRRPHASTRKPGRQWSRPPHASIEGQGEARPTSNGNAWFFAALGALGLLIALGKYTPIYSLVHSLPVLSGLRVPARFILLTNFSLAALAALGLERWRHGDRLRCRLKPALLIAGLGGVSLLIAFAATGAVEQSGRLIAALGALLVMALAVVIVSTLRNPHAAIIVVALAAVELIAFGSTVEIDRNDPTLGYQHQGVIDFLRADQNVFRIENASGAWQPDAALVRGLSDIGGIFNPLGLANYETYRGGMGNRGSALYNFLGVKYVLANKNEPPGDASFVPVVNTDPQIDVYLNTGALPRAMLIDDVQSVRSGEAAWRAIHAPAFDPSKSVVIETSETITIERQAGDKALAWGAVTANRVELNIQTPSPTMLVLSDVYYPGWIATMDDRPATIYPANFAFRAVLAPGGSHRVVFQFEPVTWKIGLLISGVTAAGLAALIVGRRRGRLPRLSQRSFTINNQQ